MSKATKGLHGTQHDVLAALKTEGATTSVAIASILGARSDNMRTSLRRLASRKLVSYNAKKDTFALTAVGRKIVQ